MGFSTSVATGIVFFTILFVFTTFYSSVNNSFNTVTDGLDMRYEARLSKDDTRISIVGERYNKSNNLLTLEVENTGDTVLDLRYIEILIDGQVVSSSAIQSKKIGATATDVWINGETLNLTLNPASYGLKYYDDLNSERLYKTVTTNLTLPRNVSANTNYTYIVDNEDHIDVFYPNGTYKMLIDSVTSPVLTKPMDISATEGYLYVIDNHDHIDKLNLDGTGGTQLIANQAPANPPRNPRAIFVTGDTASDRVYIVDYNTSTSSYWIDVYLLDGSFEKTIYRDAGFALTSPRDIYVEEYLYVIDVGADTHVDVLNTDGTTKTASLVTGLSNPTDIAVSDKDFPSNYDKLYIANNSNEIVVCNLTSTDSVAGRITYGLSSNNVYGVDVTGRIFVTDKSNGLVIENIGTRIKIVTENGKSDTVII